MVALTTSYSPETGESISGQSHPSENVLQMRGLRVGFKDVIKQHASEKKSSGSNIETRKINQKMLTDGILASNLKSDIRHVSSMKPSDGLELGTKAEISRNKANVSCKILKSEFTNKGN